jgi:hypothetical protein
MEEKYLGLEDGRSVVYVRIFSSVLGACCGKSQNSLTNNRVGLAEKLMTYDVIHTCNNVLILEGTSRHSNAYS